MPAVGKVRGTSSVKRGNLFSAIFSKTSVRQEFTEESRGRVWRCGKKMLFSPRNPIYVWWDRRTPPSGVLRPSDSFAPRGPVVATPSAVSTGGGVVAFGLCVVYHQRRCLSPLCRAFPSLLHPGYRFSGRYVPAGSSGDRLALRRPPRRPDRMAGPPVAGCRSTATDAGRRRRARAGLSAPGESLEARS